MTRAEGPSENTLVRCRAGRAFKMLPWAVGAIGLLYFGLLGSILSSGGMPRTVSDWEAFALLILFGGAAFVVPVALVIRYITRAEIVADEYGLHRRGLGRFRSVAWSEITDYYVKILQKSSSADTTIFIVEVGTETIRLAPEAWTNLSALRECIQQHATAAKAKSWGDWHERPEDWPQTFGYNTKYRNVPRFLVQWHIGTVAIVALWFAGQWILTRTMPGWGWLLTPTGLFVIAKEAILAGLHPAAAATHRRLHEQIELSAQGVRWDDGTRQITAAWEEVTDYYSIGGPLARSVVVTPHGTFDFLWTLRDSERLRRLIRRYAVNAGQAGWRTSVALERTVRDHRGQARAVRVYHYRTDATFIILTVAFMLMFLAATLYAFTAGVSVHPLLQALHQGTRPALIGLAVLFVLSLLCLLGGMVQCLTVSVRTDAAGITRRGLFGSRFIPWEQVQDFYWAGRWGMNIGVVVGPYSCIRFWDSLTDSEKLAEEIRERAAFARRQDIASVEMPGY